MRLIASFLFIIICGIMAMVVGCNTKENNSSANKGKLKSGIIHENMDLLINPGDDFYKYVNGNWIVTAEIPKDEPGYGVWEFVQENVNNNVREMVEAFAKGNYQQGSEEQLVGDLFFSIVDTNTRNQLGMQPLQNDLNKIDNIRSYDDLASYFGSASRVYGRLPFRIYIYPDKKDSDKYNVYLEQHGLGLPDREYYLADNENFNNLRKKYQDLIEEVFIKANITNPEAAAEAVYTIEYKLAEIQMTKEDVLDPSKLYNVYGTNQLNELLPEFNWTNYLTEAGLNNMDSLVIRMEDYTKSLNTVFRTTSIEDWKRYLKWCLIDKAGYRLSEELYSTFFNFYGKELYGLEAERPQWEKAINYINDNLGQLVIKLYGKEYVSAEAINKVEDMIIQIKKAFEVGIEDLEWMSPETKDQALNKLFKINTAVVYPKSMRDYSALNIKRSDFYGNDRRISAFYYDYYLSRLDKPVDKTDNWMDLFSGSYSSASNTFNIGAVFVQEPFFDETAEDAINYGGIGSVIGHELGHAFDAIGSNYDGDGNVVDWWAESDKKEFQRLSGILIEQYNQYKVLDSLFVNGEYTVNENIADLTSVVIPLKAYRLSLNGREGQIIDNFTATQRFFISYGQVWRVKDRPEYLKNQIATDSHAPNYLRVNGIVRNVPEFYTAFDINEDDSLYLAPGDRLKIW